MPEQFLYGVNVIEIISGAITVRTSKSSVIEVIGTAPEDDEQRFPLNKTGINSRELKESSKTGKKKNFAFCDKWNIFQIGATVVVIRVEESENSDLELK